MGSPQRFAAVAAVSHAKHYYNHTQPVAHHNQSTHYTVNIFFVSATLCGVLVAVCAACWRRSPPSDKPEEMSECRDGVYTVSGDMALHQDAIPDDVPGPPPAYDTVVEGPSQQKDCDILQEVRTEPCPRCQPGRGDAELPSYEAAILLRDTKL